MKTPAEQTISDVELRWLEVGSDWVLEYRVLRNYEFDEGAGSWSGWDSWGPWERVRRVSAEEANP